MGGPFPDGIIADVARMSTVIGTAKSSLFKTFRFALARRNIREY